MSRQRFASVLVVTMLAAFFSCYCPVTLGLLFSPHCLNVAYFLELHLNEHDGTFSPTTPYSPLICSFFFVAYPAGWAYAGDNYPISTGETLVATNGSLLLGYSPPVAYLSYMDATSGSKLHISFMHASSLPLRSLFAVFEKKRNGRKYSVFPHDMGKRSSNKKKKERSVE